MKEKNTNLCFKCKKTCIDNNYYGLHKRCYIEWFGCTKDDRLIAVTPEEVKKKRIDARGFEEITSSFFKGKYKKYSATLGNSKYILKVKEEDYTLLQRFEYVSNEIVNYFSLPVAWFYLLDFEKYDCFVSKNFLFEGNYRKLTHIYHFLKNQKLYTVENLVQVIFDTTHRPQDIETFLLLLLVDSLIGNNDRHGRNLGFLSKGSTHVLAPLYDNCTYLGIETLLGADINPLGKIATKETKNPSMQDYCKELIRLKYNKILKRFYTRCIIKEITHIISASFLPKDAQEAYIRLITKRYKEFITFYESLNP